MKRKTFTLAFVLASAGAMAQTVYTHADLTSTSDIIGTARYVGMGGALGALGADMSAISSNPAAIGLFRRTDIALTASGMWQTDSRYQERSTGRATFDQLGGVLSIPMNNSGLRYLNLAFNYQKRNYMGGAYYADNSQPGGLSQADQLASLANAYGGSSDFDYTLYGAAYNAGVYESDNAGFYNPYITGRNRFSYYTRGGANSYDINVSANIDDRYFLGLTLGMTSIDYDRTTSYTEERDDVDGLIQDYTIDTDRGIHGTGINVKLGGIVRPWESSPFRMGFAIETPTWYNLKTTSYWDIWTKHYWQDDRRYYLEQAGAYHQHTSADDNFLEYRLRSPWRFRLSAGSTIDRYFAWGVEYEYADYSYNHMSYPSSGFDWGWEEYSGSTPDREMNAANKQILHGQHTVKLGFELNITDHLAARMGYNYVTSMFDSNARFRQHLDSYAMDYVSETGYMNLSDVNLLTCGLGYRWKHFYIDMAYRYRKQSGSYFAFDDSFSSEPDFVQDNPALAGTVLRPVNLDLSRHTISCTLGLKF